MIEMSSKNVTGPVIRLHPADNVVIARIDVAIGTPVPIGRFCLPQPGDSRIQNRGKTHKQGRTHPEVQRSHRVRCDGYRTRHDGA